MKKDIEQPLVMVIDDMPSNLNFLKAMLAKFKYRVALFEQGELALQAAAKQPPDVVLLDINMPDMDGFQVCERFKASPSLKDIPILFLSGRTETLDKVKAFSIGGGIILPNRTRWKRFTHAWRHTSKSGCNRKSWKNTATNLKSW